MFVKISIRAGPACYLQPHPFHSKRLVHSKMRRYRLCWQTKELSVWRNKIHIYCFNNLPLTSSCFGLNQKRKINKCVNEFAGIISQLIHLFGCNLKFIRLVTKTSIWDSLSWFTDSHYKLKLVLLIILPSRVSKCKGYDSVSNLILHKTIGVLCSSIDTYKWSFGYSKEADELLRFTIIKRPIMIHASIINTYNYV